MQLAQGVKSEKQCHVIWVMCPMSWYGLNVSVLSATLAGATIFERRQGNIVLGSCQKTGSWLTSVGG
jgi:hypothetical protein